MKTLKLKCKIRKKPIKKKPIKKKTIKNRLDKKWSLIIRSRGYCEKCGANTQLLNAHHLEGRRNLSLRWDIRNGCCLCVSCHTMSTNSAHQSPLRFNEWFEEKRPEDFKYIKESFKIPPHPYSVDDYLKIEDGLDKLVP